MTRDLGAPILLGAVICTQIVATLIAVFGILMTPIGWYWAAVVWVYAIVWFLIADGVKLATYRVLDRPSLAPVAAAA